MMIFKRFLNQSIGLRKNFIKSCPPPTYDTGCTYCAVEIPALHPIDYQKDLNGTGSVPWKHVIVFLHGIEKFDQMPSKINLVPESFALEFERLKRRKLSPFHPVLVSNGEVGGLNIKSSTHHKVAIFPDRKFVTFEKKNLEEFILRYLVPEDIPETYNPFGKEVSGREDRVKSADQVKSEQKPETNQNNQIFHESPIRNDLVLICGHTQRDVRCGIIAPEVQKEFEKVLAKENLNQSVNVGLISHIGGHAYAGNLIYFSARCKDYPMIWYGRVFPENVQGIVHETIKKRSDH